jgi:phosphatidylglycerophosphatase A
LGALPLYFLIAPHGKGGLAIVATVVTGVGLWAADRVAKNLGKKDPQIVCIDEAAGVLITLIAAPYTVAGVVTGVVLFRLFDMVKPWPARLAEKKLPGGWGIVLDDVAAGLWGAAVLLGAQAVGML